MCSPNSREGYLKDGGAHRDRSTFLFVYGVHQVLVGLVYILASRARGFGKAVD